MTVCRNANRTAKKLPSYIRKEIASMVSLRRSAVHECQKSYALWERLMTIRSHHDSLIDGAFVAHLAYKYNHA